MTNYGGVLAPLFAVFYIFPAFQAGYGAVFFDLDEGK
jgi:hypothetical protein